MLCLSGLIKQYKNVYKAKSTGWHFIKVIVSQVKIKIYIDLEIVLDGAGVTVLYSFEHWKMLILKGTRITFSETLTFNHW